MIDKYVYFYYYLKVSFAIIAQSVERNIGNVEVTGSIPVNSLYRAVRKVPLFLRSEMADLRDFLRISLEL